MGQASSVVTRQGDKSVRKPDRVSEIAPPKEPVRMDQQPVIERDGLQQGPKLLFEGRDGGRDLQRNNDIGPQSATLLAN